MRENRVIQDQRTIRGLGAKIKSKYLGGRGPPPPGKNPEENLAPIGKGKPSGEKTQRKIQPATKTQTHLL